MLLLCLQMVVGGIVDEIKNDVISGDKYLNENNKANDEKKSDTNTKSLTDTIKSDFPELEKSMKDATKDKSKSDDSKADETKPDEKIDRTIDWQERRRARYYKNQMKNDGYSALDITDAAKGL